MESTHSLSSASTYLNNLLLARGLLPNGKSIDFASLTSSTTNKSQTSSTSESTRIINLVHDLVLRRDRDISQRESLASTIHTLRNDEAQRVLDLQKVQSKNADLKRDLVSAEAAERSLKVSVEKLEGQLRDHKEQIGKLKSLVDQVRAKCISDVRKRDLELEKLKSHVGSMQRGGRKGAEMGMRVNTINLRDISTSTSSAGSKNDARSNEWRLENETNDFLAAIVNETSTENVTLRKILEDSMTTLEDLIGLDREEHPQPKKLEGIMEEDGQEGIGIPGQYRTSRKRTADAMVSTASKLGDEAIVSCDTLAMHMNTILNHCRSILKDPSFVPIEEVQIRDEEILKLRVGWEKMASRWKEAVTMMDTWRRKMVDGSGDTVDVNEISQLAFGRSVAVLPNGQPVLAEDEDLSSVSFDHSRISTSQDKEMEEEAEEDAENSDGQPEDDQENGESDLDIPPEPPLKRLASSPARRGFKLKRPIEPLEETTGNVSRVLRAETRHDQAPSSLTRSADSGIGSLGSSVDEDDSDLNSQPTRRSRSKQHTSKVPLKFDDTSSSKPRSTYLRSTREDTPRLTVAEKLAAVEEEAKQARANGRLIDQPTDNGSGTKKRKIQISTSGSRKAGGRRRSTLSPEELATLMGTA